MTPPRPYGPFHLLFTAAGAGAAVWLSALLSRPQKSPGLSRLLFLCGLVLAVCEGFKQGFLYFVENNHTYDWWYFPFQLCSVPMYLGLLLPAANSVPRLRSVFTVFIKDYGRLGGIMALLEPSGLMHPYWLMTIHGFLWHFILIFMGLSFAFQTESGKDMRSFLRTIPLFLFCAALATAVNLLSHPYGDADMFYLSPYYPNSQVVFHQIALTLGVGTGNILYLLSMILGGGICHLISKKLYYFQKHHSKASLF